jgi:NDP-sugar pyrophosphorylase family protein
MRDISIAILAGGLGTRLRSVVTDRPKVLALIHGRAFLSYLLDRLCDFYPAEIVLCAGYLGEQLRETFGDSHRGARLIYSQEPAPLGTAGALRFALPLFKTENVLALNGDTFCDVDFNAMCDWHSAHQANATIALVHLPDTSRYGCVMTDEKNRITHFEEKKENSGTGWINGGVYLLKRQFIESIPTGQAVSIERETFPNWIGRELYAWKSDGRFIDIGTPESYSSAESFFAE